jgi:biopolymer transport protein ExbB/TolQ
VHAIRSGFTRAAFNRPHCKKNAGRWREAVAIYRRVANANVPASDEAAERMRKILFEHWIMFESGRCAMFELVQMGGPAMWLILVAACSGTVVFLERFFTCTGPDPRGDFPARIFNILKQKNIVEAEAFARRTPAPWPAYVRAATCTTMKGPKKIRRAIEDTGLAEVPRLERNLGLVGDYRPDRPLIGLLGTVLGIDADPAGFQQKAPQIQSGDLAGGLWQAFDLHRRRPLDARFWLCRLHLLVTRIEAIVLDMERMFRDGHDFLAGLVKGANS